MARQNRTEMSPGCLMLFALPFAAVGVGAMVLVFWTVADWMRMQTWKVVPAHILEARLEEHSDDDGTTYRAVAVYQYAYDDREYQGSRVAVSDMADNLGNFHQRAVELLEQHIARGQPMDCFVNPNSPDESVLFRDLRVEIIGFELLFAMLFGGVGFGMLIFGFAARRAGRKIKARQLEHSQQPWMWREDWASGMIRSSNKRSLVISLAVAVFWNLISLPLLVLLPGELGKGNYLVLILLAFPLVGTALAAWAIVSLRRWQKFGESTFQMAVVPGIVGGPLAGVVHTTVKLRPENGFHQKLSCVHVVVTGSGDDRTAREDIIWQCIRCVSRELIADDPIRSAIPVQFHVPFDARPTSPRGDEDRVFWRLEVWAAVAGLDYRARFELPVFRTEESSPDDVPDASPLAQFTRPETIDQVYRRCRVRRTHTGKTLKVEFPLFRNLGAAIAVSLFLGIWSGFLVLMLVLGAPIFFPLLFGLFELLILYLAIDLWFWRSEVSVQPEGIDFRAGLAWPRPQHVPGKAIESVTSVGGLQSGNQLFYDLRLTTTDGQRHTLGKRIAGLTEAQLIADDLLAAAKKSD